MNRHVGSRTPGYALVLVLVMLTLLALSAFALSRVSAGAAIDAGRSREDLQRRWALRSVERTLLTAAPVLFSAGEQAGGSQDKDRAEPDGVDGVVHTRESTVLSTRGGDNVLRYVVRLGGVTVHARVMDEQAKPNVNRIFKRDGRGGVETGVRGMLAAHELGSASVRARPLRDPIETPLVGDQQAEESLEGQKVEAAARYFVDPDQVIPGVYEAADVLDESHPLDALTCWGDGNLRLHQVPADPTAQQAAIRAVLGASHAGRSVAELLRGDSSKTQADVTPGTAEPQSNRAGAERRKNVGVVGTSSVFSVLLAAKRNARADRQLTVAQKLGDEASRIVFHRAWIGSGEE